MSDSPNPIQRLRGFIDAILLEQRRYQLWDQQLDRDYLGMQEHHESHAERLNTIDKHLDLCRVHEVVFANHKRLLQEHRETAKYCLGLLDRLKSEEFTEDQITDEIEKLSRLYDLMCLQHIKMDRERRQVLAEHRDFLRNRTGNPLDA